MSAKKRSKKKTATKRAKTTPARTAENKSRARAKKAGRRVASPGRNAGRDAMRGADRQTLGESRTFQGRRVITIQWKGQKVEAVEGRYAYKAKKPIRVTGAARERGLANEIVHGGELDPLGIGIMTTLPHVRSRGALRAVADISPDALWVEPIMLDYGAVTPTDPLFSEQWAWQATNAGSGLDAWTGNADRVVIAVLDSGIPMEAGSLSHPDLSDTTRFFPGRDIVNQDDDPADDHGHGTHVTGIAAATINNGMGVAGLWPGPVLAIKVFDAFNEGSNETFKDGVIAAVSFAKARNAHLVINYSGGGPESSVKKEAVEHARDNGALLIAAAGNTNGGGILHPAAYSPQFSNVLAVGAVNRILQRPGFASRGPEMSVVAPGDDILSTLPNYFVNLNNFGKQTKYDRLNGTSQATPMVSALAALIWSEKPSLSAQQVRDKIVSTADPISGSPNDFGSGIINMGRALQ